MRGYNEEGTTTTPFDMTVLNGLDRYHLVHSVLDWVTELKSVRVGLKQLWTASCSNIGRTFARTARTCRRSAIGNGWRPSFGKWLTRQVRTSPFNKRKN